MAPDTIILSIKLASGDFESSLKLPLPATKEQMGVAVERWMAMAFTALEMRVEQMVLTLPKESP